MHAFLCFDLLASTVSAHVAIASLHTDYHRTRKQHKLSKSIQIIAYYRQTYKAKHYINKSHAYKLATKTSKIKLKMKALSK